MERMAEWRDKVMEHKIVDVAPLMEYYRNKLLTDGDNPTIEEVLEKLRELPDFQIDIIKC